MPPPYRYRPLDKLTRAVRAALVFWITAGLAVLFVHVVEIDAFGTFLAGADEATRTESFQLAVLLTWIGALSHTLVFVLFMFWTYFACRNAHALTQLPSKYTPVWSVAWYFIPYWLLWKPYLALCDMFKASHPSYPDWRRAPVPILVALWWALFVAAHVTWTAVWVNGPIDFTTIADLDDAAAHARRVVWASVLDVAVCSLWILVVNKLVVWQRTKVAQSSSAEASRSSGRMPIGLPPRERCATDGPPGFADALVELARSGDSLASGFDRGRAAAEIRRALLAVGCARAPWLLRNARPYFPWHANSGERTLSQAIESLDRVVGAAPKSRRELLLSAILAHPNGYLRQAALTKLEGATAAIPIAAILFGADDHVPEVRATAEALLAKSAPEALAQCPCPIVADAPDDARSAWRSIVRKRLDDPAAREVLTALALASEQPDAAAAFQLLRDHLVEHGKLGTLRDAADWRLRRALASAAVEHGDEQTVEHLLVDGRVAVRAAVVMGATRWEDDRRERLMRTAIEDHSRRIRRVAAWYLREDEAVLESLRARLDDASPRDRARALETLSFASPSTTGDAAERALDSSDPRERRAGYDALAQIGALSGKHVERMLAETSGPTLVRAVRLATRSREIPKPALLPIFERALWRNVPGALSLLGRFSVWDAMPVYARALAESWPGAPDRLSGFMAVFEATGVKGWIKPTDEQRSAIIAAASAYGDRLPQEAAHLAALLREHGEGVE